MQNELVENSDREMAAGGRSEQSHRNRVRRRDRVPWVGIVLSGLLVSGLVLMSSWLFRR